MHLYRAASPGKSTWGQGAIPVLPTVCDNSKPKAASTARAHTHTMAEELDKPDPAQAPHTHSGASLATLSFGEAGGQKTRLTPCVQVTPSAHITARAEEHTIAAELDRPEPGQLVALSCCDAGNSGWKRLQTYMG